MKDEDAPYLMTKIPIPANRATKITTGTTIATIRPELSSASKHKINRLYEMIFILAFKNKFCLKANTNVSNNHII